MEHTATRPAPSRVAQDAGRRLPGSPQRDRSADGRTADAGRRRHAELRGLGAGFERRPEHGAGRNSCPRLPHKPRTYEARSPSRRPQARRSRRPAWCGHTRRSALVESVSKYGRALGHRRTHSRSRCGSGERPLLRTNLGQRSPPAPYGSRAPHPPRRLSARVDGGVGGGVDDERRCRLAASATPKSYLGGRSRKPGRPTTWMSTRLGLGRHRERGRELGLSRR